MNYAAPLQRRIGLSALISILGAGVYPLPAAEINLAKTNWVETWVTNVIEIRVPYNRYVDRYHTNWVQQFRTNVANVYRTNCVTRTLTNYWVVEQLRTNVVDAFYTNRVAVTLTNQRLVLAVQTNIINVYHTNWKTLNLTNWATVLVMKTNWITQPVTNVVEIDLLTNRFPVALTPASRETQPKALPDSLALEAKKTARPPANNLVEVLLSVRWRTDVGAPLQVQQWRVQSEDKRILCFGQGLEFKRQLPQGRYSVDVNARRDANGPLVAAHGTLVVTTRNALVQQDLVARK